MDEILKGGTFHKWMTLGGCLVCFQTKVSLSFLLLFEMFLELSIC